MVPKKVYVKQSNDMIMFAAEIGGNYEIGTFQMI